MREREANARKGPAGAVPAEQAVHDLLNFVKGQEYLPDVSLQHEDLRQEITSVMDDDLIGSLDKVMEDAMFSQHVHADDIQEYVPAYQLLKKLKELQKSRLRDAISRLTASGKS